MRGKRARDIRRYIYGDSGMGGPGWRQYFFVQRGLPLKPNTTTLADDRRRRYQKEKKAWTRR